MKFYIFAILAASLFLGCENNSKEEQGRVFFGGEIINPNNNYVLFRYPYDQRTDTLRLDDSNRFSQSIDKLQSGIYTFLHGGEYQLVFLEPGDSIMIRLNTVDFDESLVFTGQGARENNYLISSFLKYEKDNNRFMRMMWETEPQKFERELDSNRSEKLKELNAFLAKNEFSDYFEKVAEANINYDYYANKEMYPFGYYGYNNLIHFKDLPEGFYDFRNEVDYNDESLLGSILYTKFLFWNINNLALKKYYKTATHNVVFDKKSVAYNLEKLRLADSIIDNKTVKNHLLRYTTRDFVSLSSDSLETKEMLNSFLEKSTNDNDKAYMKEFVELVGNMRPGKLIPDVNLLDFEENSVSVRSLIKNPTVIYFWSSNQPSQMKNYHLKARYLKGKYPEVDFIAININDDDTYHWKNILKQYNLPNDNEFHLQNPNNAIKTLAINTLNRTILVDSDGVIINPNAMMVTSEFEEELQQAIKK